MKKLARRFAIGAMAAMMALSAFSAQAAMVDTADVSASVSAGIPVPEDHSDARTFHSLGFWGEFNQYVNVSGSAATVNAFSGNVYIELTDIPGIISYNSLGNREV